MLNGAEARRNFAKYFSALLLFQQRNGFANEGWQPPLYKNLSYFPFLSFSALCVGVSIVKCDYASEYTNNRKQIEYKIVMYTGGFNA